ncbi:MAG: hypothetical protein KDH94_02960 [Coxiellaceae bacterium]|nr:hypothetical protein [Coxiellaceae bacterium]
MTIAEQLIEEGMQIGIQQGMKIGIQKGMEKAIEKGRQEAIQYAAIKMLKMKMGEQFILEVTGLSLEEIRVLKYRSVEI